MLLTQCNGGGSLTPFYNDSVCSDSTTGMGWWYIVMQSFVIFGWLASAIASHRNAHGYKMTSGTESSRKFNEEQVASNMCLSATGFTLIPTAWFLVDASNSGYSVGTDFGIGWWLMVAVVFVLGPIAIGLNQPYGAGPHALAVPTDIAAVPAAGVAMAIPVAAPVAAAEQDAKLVVAPVVTAV